MRQRRRPVICQKRTRSERAVLISVERICDETLRCLRVHTLPAINVYAGVLSRHKLIVSVTFAGPAVEIKRVRDRTEQGSLQVVRLEMAGVDGRQIFPRRLSGLLVIVAQRLIELAKRDPVSLADLVIAVIILTNFFSV